jgi:hemin uptake protein HemP
LNKSKLDEAKVVVDAKPVRSIPVDTHRIDSRDLFVGTRELTIRHGSETYRLRLTAQNKLILTK